MALVTEKSRKKEDQEAFERLLDSLPKSYGDGLASQDKKQKVLGVKGVHHKRNKGRRR